MKRFKTKLAATAAAIIVASIVTSIGLLPGPAQAGVVRHLLWDASQRPMYQHCAADFERLHPSIRVRVQQQGWDEYWSTLSTGFIADTAPDVFANHLTKYPELVENHVLVDLSPYIARDRVDPAIYMPGLYENWGRDGKQYALPADWDTVALLVNLDMAAQAGITREQLNHLDWNPHDGGSFGRVIALLTRDQAGHHAADPAFDRNHVTVRGFQLPGTGGMIGQTEWSYLAVANGFRYQDKPWDPNLRYTDPRFAETIAWLADITAKGISATPKQIGRLGVETMFANRRVAMIPVGAWMTGYFSHGLPFAFAWVPLPKGPIGQRTSMLNGLGHSIWIGSRNREEAWQWLHYLGSPACQEVVARGGVVYPAIRGMAEIALAVQRKGGADPGTFLDMAKGSTFPPPIAAHAGELNDLVGTTLEGILYGGRPVAPALRAMQEQIRKVMKP